MAEILLWLLTLWSAGADLCEIGHSVNWDAYARRSDVTISAWIRTPELELMLLQPNDVLFVFNNDGLGADGHPHGECAVSLGSRLLSMK